MSELGQRTLASLCTDARSVDLLNDVAIRIYTNTVLLPVAARTIGEIQREFARHNIPTREKITTSLTYVANASSIDTSTIADFEEPLELWERTAGSGGLWIPMTRVNQIPPPLPQNMLILGMWEWSDDVLRVVPSVSNRDIYCRYRSQLPYPAADTEKVGGVGYYWAAVAGTAYRAYKGTGRTDQRAELKLEYDTALLGAISVASLDRQKISTRQESAGSRNRFRHFVIPG